MYSASIAPVIYGKRVMCMMVQILLLVGSLGIDPNQLILKTFSAPTAEVTEIADLEKAEIFGGRKKLLSDGSILVAHTREGHLSIFNPETEVLTPFLERGEGPDQIRGGFGWYGPLLTGEIAVHEQATRELKVFSRSGQYKTVAVIKEAIANVVIFGKNNDQVVVHVLSANAPYWDGEKLAKGKGESFWLFRIEDDRWEFQGKFPLFEKMENESADIFFQANLRVFPVPDKDEFIVVPLWGYPNVKVVSNSGNVVREFPIPHPAPYCSLDPAQRLTLYQESLPRGQLISSVATDDEGNLFLLPPRMNFTDKDKPVHLTGKVIFQLGGDGEIEQVIRLPQAVNSLSVVNNALYAFDKEEEHLYEISVPQFIQ